MTNYMGGIKTVDILSVNISTLNIEQTILKFKEWIKLGQKARICVTPVNCVLWAYQDKNLRNVYNSSAMNLVQRFVK